MAAKLDNLTPSGQIASKDGFATSWFANLWQRTMTAIEKQISDISAIVSGITVFTSINIDGTTYTGVGTTANTLAAGNDSRIVGAAQKSANLSDMANIATARGNLAAAKSGANTDITSLGSLATPLSVGQGGTGAATAAGARTALGVTATGADTAYAFRANNLSDLASAAAARTNLGLGGAAVLSVGTSAGTVAAGDDARFANAKPTYATVATDADFTITRAASFNYVRHTGTLTANRAVTLDTTGAVAGDMVTLTRTGIGIFTLTFAGKALALNNWATAVFDGSAWYLAADGTI